jgi:hypothetical protein
LVLTVIQAFVQAIACTKGSNKSVAYIMEMNLDYYSVMIATGDFDMAIIILRCLYSV